MVVHGLNLNWFGNVDTHLAGSLGLGSDFFVTRIKWLLSCYVCLRCQPHQVSSVRALYGTLLVHTVTDLSGLRGEALLRSGPYQEVQLRLRAFSEAVAHAGARPTEHSHVVSSVCLQLFSMPPSSGT